jgi:hypothetical protein
VATVFSSLASKSMVAVSTGLASKSVATVSQFGSQNRQLRFGDLVHKITAMFSWFEPQNQVGYGLSVAPQNRQKDEYDAGHASGFSGLLRLEASRTRVFQFCLKTGGGATVGGARGIIAEVA